MCGEKKEKQSAQTDYCGNSERYTREIVEHFDEFNKQRIES